MGTFLTTAKMSPALAQRVETSVSGRKGNAALVRRVIAMARVAIVATVAVAIYSVVGHRRQERRELEADRARLLERVSAASAGLGLSEKEAVARTEPWLVRLAGPYEGDLVSEELRSAPAFRARLREPAVYLRGPLVSLRSAEGIAAAAAASAKDAVLYCLFDPPSARTEVAVLEKARVGRTTAAMEETTPDVRRFDDAVLGLPFLLPDWSDRVRAAEDGAALVRLRHAFDRAPIDRAKKAATAALLIVAIDEEGDGKGPTELDGERPHDIRLVLVDTRTGRDVFRFRRHVDPAWISKERRPTHSASLDGCAFAFDVHESFLPPPPPVAKKARP